MANPARPDVAEAASPSPPWVEGDDDASSVASPRLVRLLAIVRALAGPVLVPWRRLPVHVQGRILVILPLAAILLSACIALYGNYQRARIESALGRHTEMAQGFTNVLTLMVNAETGMRGYLLTRHDEFLEPYALATEQLPTRLAQLDDLASAEPGAEPRARMQATLSTLNILIDRQRADLAWQRQYMQDRTAAGEGTGLTDAAVDEVSQHLALGKHLMDQIREQIEVVQSEQERLLSERMQEINDIRTRDYFAVFLTLAVGLGVRFVSWFLFDHGVVRRVDGLAANVRALGTRRPLPVPPSDKLDAIGRLEREIARKAEELRTSSDSA